MARSSAVSRLHSAACSHHAFGGLCLVYAWSKIDCMRTSLIRRASVAALVLAATMAPVVAARPSGADPRSDTAAARSGPAAKSLLGAKARLLGEKIVPYKLAFRGTTVGGLSGIDRNPCTGEYVMISDDRSNLQPARFYTARIGLDGAGVHSVDFTGTHPFLQPDGSPYPCGERRRREGRGPGGGAGGPAQLPVLVGAGRRPAGVVEPAGDPAVDPVRQPPRRLPWPTATASTNYEVTLDDRGPRRNKAVEAFTFGDRDRVVTSAVEGPLLQDGPDPTLEHGALVRVTQQSRDGRVLGQFAYPVERIFAESDPSSPWPPDTGVPSILAFPDDPSRYLVLERSWVAGSGYKIRLYDATTRGATEVQDIDSLVSPSGSADAQEAGRRLP